MPYLCDPRYQYCTRVGKNVGVCWSEADCRHDSGCTEPNCPLETAFGLEAFVARMRAFATTFDLWPLAEGNRPDFP